MEIANVLLAVMSFFAVALAGRHGSCKKNTLKCDGGSPGGAVFACQDGAWIVIMSCRSWEVCVRDSIPYCTWNFAVAGFAGPDSVSGFEGLPAEVSAATDDKNTTAADTGEASTALDNDNSNWNVCTPCVRYNDDCRDSCTLQGDECDATCSWKTGAVKLTTGDLRQPTVSCSDFCEWPIQ